MAAEAVGQPVDAGLFSELRLADVHAALIRNIVSLRVSEDLFDDLSDKPEDWKLAQQVEDEVKPRSYRSPLPVIHRPFEDAQWFNAIGFPFRYWAQSRFSDGSFGVWYGCDSVETSVWETAWHWYGGFLADAGFQQAGVVGERKLYQVNCEAALLDLRRLARKYSLLVHPSDYSYSQAVGRRVHREGHPGLINRSARWAKGECYAIFNPQLLSEPRQAGSLTYRLENDHIRIEARPGKALLPIPLAGWK